MSPSLASFGFIVFLGMFLPINSNLNLYMDAKETFRLLGEFAGYLSLRLGPGGTCFFLGVWVVALGLRTETVCKLSKTRFDFY